MKRKSLLLLLLMALFAPIAMNAQTELTVCDGTASSNVVPAYIYYFDDFTRCQFVMPADSLTGMSGGTIYGLKFYVSSNTTASNIPYTSVSTVDVYLMEVNYTSLEGLEPKENGQIVYQGTLEVMADKSDIGSLTIDFDTPYSYGGGNLLVGIENTDDLGYKNIYFTGVNATGASWAGSNGSSLENVTGSQRNFLPKTTFSYVPDGGTLCEKPQTLVADPVTAHEATLTWTGGSGTYNYEYKTADAEEWGQTFTTSSYNTLLSNLLQNTSYQARVQSVCGNDVSAWKTVSFTTEIACPAPINLTAELVPGDGTKVILSWTETGDATQWQLSINGGYSTELITSNPYTVSGLTPEEIYTFSVRAYCDNIDQSSWSNEVTAQPTNKLVIGSGDATSTNLPTSCFYKQSLTQQIYTVQELGESGLIESVAFFNNSTSDQTRNLDLYIVNTDKEVFEDNTDWIGVTSADLMFSGSVVFASKVWTTIQLTGFVYDGSSNIAIVIDDNTGSYTSSTPFLAFEASSQALSIKNDNTNYEVEAPNYNGTLENVKSQIRVSKVELGSCIQPTSVTVDYQGGTTAVVSWNSDATSFNIEVNGNIINNVSNPYTLQGLAMDTQYSVCVQAKCSANDLSPWSSPVTFITDFCMPQDQCEITFELTDSFGDGWNGNAIKVTDVATGKVLGTFANTSDAAAGEAQYYTLAVCPGRVIEFSWVSGSYPGETSYVVYTANDEVIFSGSNTLSSPVQYTTDCTVDACRKPADLAAEEVGARYAELSWTERGEATSWVLGYTVNGVFDSISVSTNPFTWNGLTPETSYIVMVRPECEEEAYKWSDEITFTTPEACPAPVATASDITYNSANINWDGQGNYQLRYCLTENLPDNNFDDSNFYQWTTIDADGDGYDWVLASECGGIYLAAGADITGNGHNDSYDFVTSGSYSNVSGSPLTPDNYLVSPQINLGGSISFYACAQDASYAAEHFGVAVSTDGQNFTTIQEWTLTAKGMGNKMNEGTTRSGNRDMGNWYHFTADLSDYSGTGYVAIRHFDCTDYFMLDVDDIIIEQPNFDPGWINVNNATSPYAMTGLASETGYTVQVRANCGSEGYSAWASCSFITLPSCMAPTALTVDEVGTREATLSWTSNGEENMWRIAYSADSDFDPDQAEFFLDARSNPATIEEGLEPDQTYYAYVRATCSEDDFSAWSNKVSFTTIEACPKPTDFAASDVMPTSAVLSWNSDNSAELEYAVVPAEGKSDRGSWLYYDNGTYSSSIGTGGSDVYWAVMFPADMLTNNAVTKVSMYEASDGNSTQPITIYVYSGGDDAPGTLLYEETVETEAANDFHEVTLAEPVTIDMTQNLWIVLKEYGSYPAMGCEDTGDPNGRWISLDGTDWADVAGYDLNYTWMVRAYLDASFDPDDLEWIAATAPYTSPYTLTGLDPETTYAVRVRANCGGDGYSNWVYTSFTTPNACENPKNLEVEPMATTANVTWTGYQEMYNLRYRIPAQYEAFFYEDFDSAENNSLPEGWTSIDSDGDGNDWYVWNSDASASYTHSGTGLATSASYISGALTPDNWLITPQLDLQGTMRVWMRAQDPSYPQEHYAIYLSTTGNAVEDFDVTLVEESYDLTGEYVEVTADLSAYTGQTGYIAIRHFNCTDWFRINVDDFGLFGDMIPGTGEWIDIQTSEPSALLEDLEPETTYEVQVQGICSKTQTTEWTDLVTFTTVSNCEPITDLEVTEVTNNSATITWTGYQGAYNIRYRIPEHEETTFFEDFEGLSGGLPSGWTSIDADGDGYDWYSQGSYADYAHSGEGIVTSASYTSSTGALNPDNWLITPQIELQGTMKVWMRAQDPSYPQEHYAIYLSTTGNAVDDFDVTLVEEAYDLTGDYVEITADLSEYAGQMGYIAIRHFNCSDWFRLNVDDFGLYTGEVIPASEWITASSNEGTYTMEDLLPETTYEVQVQGNCTPTEMTEWTDLVEFTTLPSCLAPSNVEFSDVTYNSAVVSWVENGDATSWQIEVINYSLVGNYVPGLGDIINVTTNPYTLTDLDASSLYVVYVYSVCGPNEVSAASDMNFFETEASPCAAPVDTQVLEESITANSATMIWTAGGDETTWQVVYGQAYDLLYLYDNEYYFDEAAINALTPITVTENTYTFTALEPETYYLAFVRSMCDDGTYSAWVDAYTMFETPEASGEEEQTETVTLTAGWGWFSSFVEYPDGALELIANSIAETSTTATIKSQNDGYLSLEDGSWTGTLEGLYNEQMYLISSDGGELSLTSILADPNDHPITLGSGWNWIGFISPVQMGVDEALMYMNPTNEDMIKGQEGFASYDGGWSGSLVELGLTPGNGYIYLNNGEETTLVYPVASRGFVSGTRAATHWNTNPYLFPTNLTMMVTLDAEQFAMSEGSHEIAAFVNGECRGTALLKETKGQYIGFLTVTGNQGDEVSFRLFDVNGNVEYAGIADEQIIYRADDIYGSIKNPMTLHFRNTGVNEFGQVSLFPNPTSGKVMIQGQAIETVNVYNAMGQLLLTEVVGNADQVELNLGSLSAGVYTINVVMTNGQQSNRMVVKE